MAFTAAANFYRSVRPFSTSGLGDSAKAGREPATAQREQMEWAQRAYRLDTRTLRIDILNAVKEDVRDHHHSYASRIDTLLLLHTLLLTFALATLQFSGQYVPQSGKSCSYCVEVKYPVLVPIWVFLIGLILVLPFWCIMMLIWCKLRLDSWLRKSVHPLNRELRETLAGDVSYVCGGHSIEETAELEMECMEQAVERLHSFVEEHQDAFAEIWTGECEAMMKMTTTFLWVNAVVAVTITAGMFWMFLSNHLDTPFVADAFVAMVGGGMLFPFVYMLFRVATKNILTTLGLRPPRTPDCGPRPRASSVRSHHGLGGRGGWTGASMPLLPTSSNDARGALEEKVKSLSMRAFLRRQSRDTMPTSTANATPATTQCQSAASSAVDEEASPPSRTISSNRADRPLLRP